MLQKIEKSGVCLMETLALYPRKSEKAAEKIKKK